MSHSNFDIGSRLGCMIICCNVNLVKPYHEELEKIVTDILKSHGNSPEFKAIALDLKTVNEIDHHALRSIAVLSKAVKATQRSFFGVAASEALSKFIVEQGLDIAMPLHETVEKSLSVSVFKTASGISVDMNFVNTFIESTIKTLKVQCFIEPKPGKPFLKGQGETEPTDIAGVIGLTSKAFTGSIALCFPARTFLRIISNMFGEECTEIDEDTEDSAGELLNIIFGQTKIILNKKGYSIEKALPTVVRGSALKVRHLSQSPTIVLPFTAEGGSFHIEIGLENPIDSK